MDINLFEQLHRDGLVTNDALEQVKEREQSKPVSVHWDLRTLLYFSILLLSGGIGILVYKNIDTIGHVTIVSLTGILAATCFFYCFKVSASYSKLQVASPNVWFDYILLLGCLLMLTFIGYLQYQYHVFGMKWGMATFVPMLLLFFGAYYFDHKGVLSLAITNLGAWMGIAVEPLQIVKATDFSDGNIIINGVILGALLHLFGWLSERVHIKEHFAPVYKNFGMHVLLISLLASMGHFDNVYFLWFLVLIAVVIYYFGRGIALSSFYYIVAAALYGYFGISYVVTQLIGSRGEFAAYCVILYFIGSGVGMAIILMRLNKQVKGNDRLQ